MYKKGSVAHSEWRCVEMCSNYIRDSSLSFRIFLNIGKFEVLTQWQVGMEVSIFSKGVCVSVAVSDLHSENFCQFSEKLKVNSEFPILTPNFLFCFLK